MRNIYLVSTAIFIASSGMAIAQGTSPGGSTTAPAPAQSAAPAEKTAPADKSAPSTAKDAPVSTSPKATQSDTMAPKTGEMKKDTAAPKNADTKTPATSTSDQKAGAADMKKDTAAPKNADTKTPASTSDKKAGTTPSADTKAGTSADSKGAAGAAPPPEKQSQITTAIKSEKVEEVTNVNFNISVGTVVPSTVRYYPLPTRIIEIYPEWRGYDFIRVRGRYIILRPTTHEIVYIIEG
jgi:hypothetical protein